MEAIEILAKQLGKSEELTAEIEAACEEIEAEAKAKSSTAIEQ